MEDRPSTRPWRLIPAEEHAFPMAPPSQRLRRGLRTWLRRFRPAEDRPADVPLATLAEARLARLVPDLPIEEQATALLEALEESGGRLLVLTPPDGSWAAAVERAVERLDRRGVARLAPPADRLAVAIPETARALLAAEGGVAIPQLERWFLRHHDGLASCRALLSALAGRPGTLLVGCDIWSWLFLSRALAAPALLPTPKLPAALDADGLEAWLELPAGARQRSDGGTPGRTFFQLLAAEGLGMPGLIRDLWRECLRRDAKPDAAAAPEGDDDGGELWLRPPETGLVTAAPIPADGPPLLYALLLHGGLAPSDLRLALPLSASALVRLLAELESAGVVGREAGVWQIERRAYPLVRHRLAQEGYLVGVA